MRADLLAIAAIFSEQWQLGRDSSLESEVKFTLRTADGITYESSDADLFHEGAEIDLKPVASIEFEFSMYRPRRTMSLTIVQGGSYSDSLRISGDDRLWVQGTFGRLAERISAVAPSESLFTRHPRLLFHLLAVAVGAIILKIVGVLVYVIIMYALPSSVREALHDTKPPTGIGWSLFDLSITPPLNLFWCWLFGVNWAGGIHDWLLSAWPSIELDVGPEHERRPSMRRARMRVFVFGIIIPLVASVIYDLLKLVASITAQQGNGTGGH